MHATGGFDGDVRLQPLDRGGGVSARAGVGDAVVYVKCRSKFVRNSSMRFEVASELCRAARMVAAQSLAGEADDGAVDASAVDV